MSYINAGDRLPAHILELIQDYVEGEYIYIPKKESNKKSWGESTSTKKELARRNDDIYTQYMAGVKVTELAQAYFLSPKSIQRIVLNKKRQAV